MKSTLYAISVSLMLSFTSSAVFAYSGSECEVNDCTSAKPAKANSKATKGQAKAKAEGKAKPATPKEQAKDKLTEKLPSQLQGLTGLLK
jgi:hypothetical protein